MSEPHVITGLKAKAHEIHMRIAKLEDQIKVYRKDLAVIGETLRIFGDPNGFYVKPEALFNRGSLGRAILMRCESRLMGWIATPLQRLLPRRTTSTWKTTNLPRSSASASMTPCTGIYTKANW